MENSKWGDNIERSEVWTIAIAVTLINWIIVVVLLVAFWDRLCAKITITALEYGARQILAPEYRHSNAAAQSREAASKQPKPWYPKSLNERMEEFKADLERVAPSETHEQTLERIDRERRDLEAYLFDDQYPNKRL